MAYMQEVLVRCRPGTLSNAVSVTPVPSPLLLLATGVLRPAWIQTRQTVVWTLRATAMREAVARAVLKDDTGGRCRATWVARWTTPSLRVHTHCISAVFDPLHAMGAKDDALTPPLAAGGGGGVVSGDTGPLVYPAGFVYVFSMLHYLTRGDVHTGQVWPVVVTPAIRHPLVGRRLPTRTAL